MKAARTPWWIWLLVPVASVMFSMLYFQVLMPVKAAPGDLALFERGIGSPMLKMLNGYLGAFFGLRFLGNTALWALPLMVVLGMRWRSLVRWQRAAIFFLGMAALLIGAAGGFNYRYAMTLVPVLIAWVMMTFEKGMQAHGLRAGQRTAVHVGLLLATIYNSYASMDLADRMAKADPIEDTFHEDDEPFYTKFDTGPENLDQWLSMAGVGASDRVLVNNLPVYYYTTHRPGLYYWCGSDQYFGPDGERPIFRTRTDDEVVQYLADSLSTYYIFSDRNLSRYDLRFEAFLESHCTLVAEDDKHHTLHRLKDTFGH